MTRLVLILTFAIASVRLNAQAEQNSFDNLMLSNGKMYTVVGVILIIFVGIIIYLYNTDKKLKSIENQIKSE